jgi:hypothetical protein
MMLVGTLSAQSVRQTYLRGIDLGDAWTGPSADAAINTLLMTALARAEELMNIHWTRWRVAAPPDPGMVAGTDYDVAHTPVPYLPLREPEDFYRVTLWQHDVQAITRLRLWVGTVAGVPVYTPVPLHTVTYDYPEEALHVPPTLVPDPTSVLGWAVDYVIGFGALPFSVVQWCALGAAIQVLSSAASARDVSHGLARQRLLMDGIEEAIDYGSVGTQGRPGGMYAGTVSALQDQRDDIDLVKLRFRYQGNHVPVPGVMPPVAAPTRP